MAHSAFTRIVEAVFVAQPDYQIIGACSPNSPVAAAVFRQATSYDSSQAWQVANYAIYVPCVVPKTCTVKKMAVVVGGVTGGNIDVGIYTSAGARLVSAGSTALGTINTFQEFDITDTILVPGLYFVAQAQDGTTGTTRQGTLGWEGSRSLGVKGQASAFPLPSTATFAALSSSVSRPHGAHAYCESVL